MRGLICSWWLEVVGWMGDSLGVEPGMRISHDALDSLAQNTDGTPTEEHWDSWCLQLFQALNALSYESNWMSRVLWFGAMAKFLEAEHWRIRNGESCHLTCRWGALDRSGGLLLASPSPSTNPREIGNLINYQVNAQSETLRSLTLVSSIRREHGQWDDFSLYFHSCFEVLWVRPGKYMHTHKNTLTMPYTCSSRRPPPLGMAQLGGRIT